MRYKNNKVGFSLVEVLVAISILMLSIIGPITIAAKSLQSSQYSRQQNTAFFLAQEGITIANTLRNDGAMAAHVNASVNPWSWRSNASLAPCFTATGCNIDFRDATPINNVVNCASSATACTLRFNKSAPRATYQLVSGEYTPYRRVITFSYASADEILVESTVEWTSTLLGGTQEVRLSTSLFNLFK